MKVLLAVDIGNSNVKLAAFRGSKIPLFYSSVSNKNEDEYKRNILEFLENKGLKINEIENVAIASVVKELSRRFSQISKELFGKNPIVIKPGNKFTLEVESQGTGIDRVLAATAACEKFGPPLIIVDIGTALTINVISKEAKFLGGAIAPGPQISAASLSKRTSSLPQVKLKFPQGVIGRSTEESIRSGLLYGTVEIIDGLIQRMREELKENPKVVATGGYAKLISQKSKTIQAVEPYLTLQGILMVYEKMEEKKRLKENTPKK